MSEKKCKIAIKEVVVEFQVNGVDDPTRVIIKIDSEGAGNYVRIKDEIPNTDNELVLDDTELSQIAKISEYLCGDINDIFAPQIDTENLIDLLTIQPPKGGKE